MIKEVKQNVIIMPTNIAADIFRSWWLILEFRWGNNRGWYVQ